MWWLIFPAIIVLFLAVVLIRTAAFKPRKAPEAGRFDIDVDVDTVAAHLAEMIRCKTVSSLELERIDRAQFERFIALLPEFYPNVYKACEFERMAQWGLLLRWPGREAGAPTMFMAHYDVVPVDESEWSHPPFAAELVDGVMYGRGTLDTKNTLCATLEAAELMIKQGFTPRHDILFAFGGDEECGGTIARHMADTLHDRNMDPAMVIDEGGAVVSGVFPGVKRPAALIGISEKGYLDVELSTDIPGGHSSTPPAHTGLGELARAAVNIEGSPFPRSLTPPVAGLFGTLGRYSTFAYRLIFANLWCFLPVLDAICKKGGGEMNAMIRTTTALTQAEGSGAPNVMPGSPTMVFNLRTMPGSTNDQALARLKKLTAKLNIKFRVMDNIPPSAISEYSGEPWERISSAVRQTYPEAIVSPFLMLGGTDSKSYAPYCKHVFRFTGAELTGEERSTIHAFDEHIPVKKLESMVKFYARVMHLS